MYINGASGAKVAQVHPSRDLARARWTACARACWSRTTRSRLTGGARSEDNLHPGHPGHRSRRQRGRVGVRVRTRLRGDASVAPWCSRNHDRRLPEGWRSRQWRWLGRACRRTTRSPRLGPLTSPVDTGAGSAGGPGRSRAAADVNSQQDLELEPVLRRSGRRGELRDPDVQLERPQGPAQFAGSRGCKIEHRQEQRCRDSSCSTPKNQRVGDQQGEQSNGQAATLEAAPESACTRQEPGLETRTCLEKQRGADQRGPRL